MTFFLLDWLTVAGFYILAWLSIAAQWVVWFAGLPSLTATLSGTFGFVCGLLIGMLLGYWVFIMTLSTKVKPPVLESLLSADGQVEEKVLKRIFTEMPMWMKNPDYDRVDWLNSLLREMWPFVNKAVEAQVQASVGPIIKEKKPAFIQSITFDALSIGTLPPTIQGVKVYDTTDDEVILEPVLKWAGDWNIIVALKFLGIKASVQLTDLTLFLTPRITMKPLIPVFPCFSKITVSLMDKPTVDFGLKLIGGDLMAIPGLYPLVQDIISNAIMDMMLWPKAMEVFKLDDALTGKKPIGWLHVRNMSARKLKNTERFGVVDPYVTLSLGDLGRATSTVKYNQLDPNWTDEEYTLVVKDLQIQNLELSLFDKEEQSADRLMSMQRVPLKDLVPGEAKRIEAVLVKNKAALATPNPANTLGAFFADLTFVPFSEEEQGRDDEEDDMVYNIPDTVPVGGGLLTVTIHVGEGLEGKSHSNPFVVVRFRQEERQTKHLHKQTDGEFLETFEFLVDEAPKDEELRVDVFSKNLAALQFFNEKEPIGHVTIPLLDVVNNLRMNDLFHLNDSNGKLKIELAWIEKKRGQVVKGELPKKAPSAAK
eukprot:TRINITY_DN19297_c0_g1_i1.p1 TRINITY_DN19297_c0_g1~~TRINITY_DN19297_c0_g1_i1.p1  ORF type:complete len:594 (-),score=180.44 TRINITY_DN19297_c0_g1_i1:905-2686(-)